MKILKTLFLLFPLILWGCTNTSRSYQKVTPAEFMAQLKNHSVLILDIRTKQEFEQNQIPGARNLPAEDPEFDSKIKTVSKELKFMVYCDSGKRSQEVAEKISKEGYEVFVLEGGLEKWIDAGYNIVDKTIPEEQAPAKKSVEDEFYNNIKGDKLVMIDFYTTWCGPCKMMAPFVDRLINENADDVIIMKIDTDIEVGLAKKYEIQSIPTLVFFKGNEQLYYRPGFHSYEELLELINKYK